MGTERCLEEAILTLIFPVFRISLLSGIYSGHPRFLCSGSLCQAERFLEHQHPRAEIEHFK